LQWSAARLSATAHHASAPRHEDQLTVARADGFTAPSAMNALDREAGAGDGLAKSLLAPEAQTGVASELFTTGDAEAVVVREADHVIAEARHLDPDQDGRAVAHGDLPARVLRVPSLPDACLRVVGVEREPTTPNQRSRARNALVHSSSLRRNWDTWPVMTAMSKAPAGADSAVP